MTNFHDLVTELTPIFRYGSKDAIQKAIESNDNVFLARNKEQHTLLHILAENVNPGIEDVIKGRNIDLNVKSRYGDVPLGHAIEWNNYNVIEYLLKQNVNSDFENSPRGYPFHRQFLLCGLNGCNVEQRLRCMKLLLEYGKDYEILSRNKNYTIAILEKVSQDQTFELAKPVLTQFAIREVLGKPLPNVIREQILSRDRSKTYFNSRIHELEKMKTSKIFGVITEFELFTASDENLSFYARNRRLVSKFPKFIAHINFDPYIMELWKKRLSKVSEIAKSREKGEQIISENIGALYEYNALVTRIIVDYLDDHDIQKLL